MAKESPQKRGKKLKKPRSLRKNVRIENELHKEAFNLLLSDAVRGVKASGKT